MKCSYKLAFLNRKMTFTLTLELIFSVHSSICLWTSHPSSMWLCVVSMLIVGKHWLSFSLDTSSSLISSSSSFSFPFHYKHENFFFLWQHIRENNHNATASSSVVVVLTLLTFRKEARRERSRLCSLRVFRCFVFAIYIVNVESTEDIESKLAHRWIKLFIRIKRKEKKRRRRSESFAFTIVST